MATKKKVLPHDQEDIIQICIEGLVKGNSKEELIALITEDYRYKYISLEDVELLIKRSVGVIKEQTLVDIDKIIPLHVELYEKIYQECDKIRFIPGKLKAMRGKEKIVGLHRESNYIEIHNTLNIEVETEAEYDLSKLTPTEQKTLAALSKRIER